MEKNNDRARGPKPERKKKRGGEEPQREEPRRGERLTSAALRERERKYRAEASRSPARESSEAEDRASELPPVRAGCGPGGGPVCWVDRQRGGTGEEVDSYPTELEVLGLRDQWLSFAPETVKKLTYDDWVVRLTNFFRVAYPGALAEGKDSVMEPATRWNDQVADGRRWKRWTLVEDLMRTYPLASNYWLAVVGKQLHHMEALKEMGLGTIGRGLSRLQQAEPAGSAPPGTPRASEGREGSQGRGSSPERAEEEGHGVPRARSEPPTGPVEPEEPPPGRW